MTPDGVGLVTAFRVLCHIACPTATVSGIHTHPHTHRQLLKNAPLVQINAVMNEILAV